MRKRGERRGRKGHDARCGDSDLCLGEGVPPTFVNVMTHLPVHLVEQLLRCGPVHCRWMYPIEQYMKTLKDYMRTYAHPEGNIAEGYHMNDALGFCIEYMH